VKADATQWCLSSRNLDQGGVSRGVRSGSQATVLNPQNKPEQIEDFPLAGSPIYAARLLSQRLAPVTPQWPVSPVRPQEERWR
jgi:hypothetical protein